MKIVFSLIGAITLSFCLTAPLSAQNLSEFKSAFENSGIKPKKKAPRKVYINTFKVMVEMYREDVDYKAKKEFRGQGRGEATAAAALGLTGVNTKALQDKADKLYEEFVADLTSKGFTIINVNEAKKAEYFKNAKDFTGPLVRESANPGILEILPSNFRGLTTERDLAGKKDNKSTGLMANFQSLKGIVKNTNVLSKQLDDAIVIDVNLVLGWSEAGSNWIRSMAGANAKVQTNLALGSKEVSAPKTDNALSSRGREEYYKLPNTMTVAQGSGLKGVTWEGYLKKPIFIGGVLDDAKAESFNRGAASKTYELGNQFIVTEWRSTFSKNAKFVQVDGEKFADALYLSGSAFLADQLNYFYNQYK